MLESRVLAAYVGEGRAQVSWFRSLDLQKRIQAQPLSTFRGLVESHGNLLQFYRGLKRITLVNEPTEVTRLLASPQYQKTRKRRPVFGNGLVTAEGTVWRMQRELGQDFLKLAAVGASENREAILEEQVEKWSRQSAVDVFDAVSRLNLHVSFRWLLDLKPTPVEENAFLSSLGVLIRSRPRWWQIGNPFFGKGVEYRRALLEYRQLVRGLLRRTDLGGNHLAGFLHREGARRGIEVPLFDQVSTYLLASSDTTASALTSAIYFLSGDVGLQDRVKIEGAPVVRNVLKETLRLFPPVWLISRQAKAEDRVGNLTIRAGEEVVFLPYLLHRSPLFWSDASRFDPNRFEGQTPTPGSYFPFGFGPRACVGAQLLFQLGTELLFLLADKFILHRASEALDPQFHFTLRPTVPPVSLLHR